MDSARCGSLCEEMTDYIQLSFTTHHTGAQSSSIAIVEGCKMSKMTYIASFSQMSCPKPKATAEQYSLRGRVPHMRLDGEAFQPGLSSPGRIWLSSCRILPRGATAPRRLPALVGCGSHPAAFYDRAQPLQEAFHPGRMWLSSCRIL